MTVRCLLGLCALLFAATPARAASLTVAEVNRVAAQAEQAAEALGQTRFTIAVVDRVGNVRVPPRRGQRGGTAHGFAGDGRA